MRQHGVRALTDRDRELLRFVGEQYLVTLPQLAYLADCSQRTARWLRTRWQRAGLVDAQPLFADEATFVWLTRRGLNAAALPWRPVRPSWQWAQRAATVVDVRLAVHEQYPQARWLSRRMLAHTTPRPSPLPDALIRQDRHSVAVLARTWMPRRKELDQLLVSLIPDYPHVLIVLPEPNGLLEKRLVEERWPATIVVHSRLGRTVELPVLPQLPGFATANVGRCGDFPTPQHTAPHSDWTPAGTRAITSAEWE